MESGGEDSARWDFAWAGQGPRRSAQEEALQLPATLPPTRGGSRLGF